MKYAHLPLLLTPLLLSVNLTAAADTATGKTRAQVLDELREAQRTGDIRAGGYFGDKKLNEVFPNRYPHMAAERGKTRAEVVAELEAAQRSGDLPAGGYFAGQRLNEVFPQEYPPVAATPVKSRAQVMAELEEAQRTGTLPANAYTGQTLAEMYPGRYMNTASVGSSR